MHTQLFAGHETTSSLLGAGLAELLQQPDRIDAIRARPEAHPHRRRGAAAPRHAGVRLEAAHQEARRGSPTPTSPRAPTCCCCSARANRDPHVFADPDAIDLHRENARAHLSFGHGIHFCLGASLARLESQVVLEELTQRLPGLRMLPQELDYLAQHDVPRPRSACTPSGSCPLAHATDVSQVGGKATGLAALMRRAACPSRTGS